MYAKFIGKTKFLSKVIFKVTSLILFISGMWVDNIVWDDYKIWND